MRFILRTFLALALSLLCGFLGTRLWGIFALWLTKVMHPGQVALDTVALAIPLAARSVSQASIALSVPPIFLACWAAAHPVSWRCQAACAGLGAGILMLTLWQGVLSLYSGYAFSLRYALPQPVTSGDLLVVSLVCVLEVWVTLHVIPFRGQGRLRGGIRHPSEHG